MCTIGIDGPMCTIGMDSPYVYNGLMVSICTMDVLV